MSLEPGDRVMILDPGQAYDRLEGVLRELIGPWARVRLYDGRLVDFNTDQVRVEKVET